MYIPLKTIKFILNEFEKELKDYSIKRYVINEFETILVVENSLILYEKIFIDEQPVCFNAYEIYKDKVNEFFEIPKVGNNYYSLLIKELTFNNINYKHHHSRFIENIKNITGLNYFEFTYSKFQGLDDEIKQICKKLPEINIKDKLSNWSGFDYNIIVFELLAFDGKKGFGIFHTNQKPQIYVNTKAQGWIKKGYTYGNMNMIHPWIDEYNTSYSYHLENAFLTYKKTGLTRQYVLENYLTYFYLYQKFQNIDEIYNFERNVVQSMLRGDFNNVEKYSYIRPKYRWITEELVYRLTKKLYKGYKVLYQYKPDFLISNLGGQMSYDVFIPHLSIAIEYQGEQHFKPVDFFGGQDSLIRTQERDILKKVLSEKNNIKLIYIYYYENVTEALIKLKVEEALKAD